MLLTFDPESGQSATWPLRELSAAPRFPVPRRCPRADDNEQGKYRLSHRILAVERPFASELGPAEHRAEEAEAASMPSAFICSKQRSLQRDCSKCKPE